VSDKEKPKDDPTKLPPRREQDIEKRSRFCQHGNVWGRCPKGC
jgi:hypothetical protein